MAARKRPRDDTGAVTSAEGGGDAGGAADGSALVPTAAQSADLVPTAAQSADLDVAALAEACALRVGCFGRDGVPVVALWAHAAQLSGSPTLDADCIQYLWGALCACGDISFIPQPGAAPVLHPPPMARDAPEGMIAVGGDDLVAHALGLQDPNTTLNGAQQRLLQRVAQAGEAGAMQNELTREMSMDARHVHYNVRQLEGHGLVRVQKALKSNVICLSRHYSACLRALANGGPAGVALNVSGDAKRAAPALNYGPIAERVVTALRAATSCTLVEAEVRVAVGMKGNAHKQGWKHVKGELTKRGVITAHVSMQGRVQKCLHLKPGSAPIGNSQPARALTAQGEAKAAAGPRVRVEETLQQQIYDMVVDAGETGITHAELNRRLHVSTKLSYPICCALVADSRLESVAETIKSQVNYRLIAPCHYRAENFSTASASSESAPTGAADSVVPVNADASSYPRTIQQQRRRDKICEYVNAQRMVWMQDLHQWMKSELGDVDLKVLTRLVKQLDAESKVKWISFLTRTSLQRQKQTPAVFAVGAPLDGPDVQRFVEAKTLRRRKVKESVKKPDLHDVAVDHLPGVSEKREPRQTAAMQRARRLEFGFIEGRAARAKALHLYLWGNCGSSAEGGRTFSMASILTDMKIRDYAQLLGIVQDIPDVDEHLKQNVKVSDLPEPHCNELISGQPTFYSFKSMLVMLMKLGLASAARSDGGGQDAETDGSTDPCSVGFTHCKLATTVRLPGNADQATTSSGRPPAEPSSTHLALGTVAQFGITSDTARDRSYSFDQDGALADYWSDLQSFVTERFRASMAQHRDADQGPKPTPEDVSRQEGLTGLHELFRLKSWSVAKSLSAAQLAAVERATRDANIKPPYDLKAIIGFARATKVTLVSLVKHFNDMHHPERPAVAASRLMPIRHRSPRQQASKTSSAASGPRKSRKRHASARSDSSAQTGSAAGMAHEPDHVAAYMASSQAERRQDATSSAETESRPSADNSDADTAQSKDVEDVERIVPRRAAKLQWNGQMDFDLAMAYMSEKSRVAQSEKSYRVSWANIGAGLSVSAARARRRWAVLQKDPKFKQAITMASSGGAGSGSQSSLLQLVLQGGTASSSVETRLPDSVAALQRKFHIRDGSTEMSWTGDTINPKLSALMLALKAILLVPEDQCERSTAISLLTRFENNDIETAIKIMKDQHLLTSVKGAKVNSRAFRLSAKFHEGRRLITENYHRDIFDGIRKADEEIQSRLNPAGVLIGDVDPVTGGGYTAAVLGRMVTGTLALSATSLSAEGETTADASTEQKSNTAPHASILSHLLLVGAVQQSSSAGDRGEGANVTVQLPPWKIAMKTDSPGGGPQHISYQPDPAQHAAGHIDWSQIELPASSSGTVAQLPEKVLSAAEQSSLPQEAVSMLFSLVHAAGREGTTLDDIVSSIVPTEPDLAAPRRPIVLAAVDQALGFLASQHCVVCVSAWDHHRYVSGLLDHFWSVPRQSTGSGASDSGAADGFQYATALNSWTRIDSGVDAPLLRSLRQAIAAVVMKHPGIEEGAVRARVESIQPQEVQDLLTAMVKEGLLRSRDQRVVTQRTSLFHAPKMESVRCYWATPLCLGAGV